MDFFILFAGLLAFLTLAALTGIGIFTVMDRPVSPNPGVAPQGRHTLLHR